MYSSLISIILYTLSISANLLKFRIKPPPLKKNNYRKNKIYIRTNGVDEEELIKMLICESEQMNKNLEMLKEWRTDHQEYELEGIGLCIDSYNVFSLNFYYCFV